MTKKKISTDQAPKAIGPYSQAVAAGGFLFVSGQIPMDPATSEIVQGTAAGQMERVIQNVEVILSAAGGSLEDVVLATLYLKDMGQFDSVNKVYNKYFSSSLPARACVEVSALPRGVEVELQVVAFLGENVRA
jgi:2-iminobutanoate/2-iminopropanoate deaminase